MDIYTITPFGGGYWIELLAIDGSRKSLERYPSEEAANERLAILERNALIAASQDRAHAD